MVFFNYSTMQMAAKVVYYGPGLCGKTTNLHYIYGHTTHDSRGEMVSLETETDRTLFFDLLPLDVGSIAGFNTRIQLYTVPGQVFYNTTRKLVLKGVDGVVFVIDSQRAMMQANLDSFRNLEENLAEMGLSVETLPLVLQYNKRDLNDIYSVEELNRAVNRQGWPWYEASAVSGQGVFETLKGISKHTLLALKKRLGRSGADAPARLSAASHAGAPASSSGAAGASGAAAVAAGAQGNAGIAGSPGSQAARPAPTGAGASTAPGSPHPTAAVAAPDSPATPSRDAAAAAFPGMGLPQAPPAQRVASGPAAAAQQPPAAKPGQASPAATSAPAAPPPSPGGTAPGLPAQPAVSALAAASPLAAAPALAAAGTAAPAAPAPARSPAKTSTGKSRSVDVLGELEKLRREAMQPASSAGAGQPWTASRAGGAPAIAPPAHPAHPANTKAAAGNGRAELSRNIEMTLKRSELARARRILLSFQVEDDQHRVVDAVRDLQVEIKDSADLDKLLLRINIALHAKE